MYFAVPLLTGKIINKIVIAKIVIVTKKILFIYSALYVTSNIAQASDFLIYMSKHVL